MNELENLKKKIVEDSSNFVIVLGAGASMPAGLPSWKDLKEKLCEVLGEYIDDEVELQDDLKDINSAKTLWTAFSRLKKHLGSTSYEKAIHEILDPEGLKTPQLYHKIWKLNAAGIIDFNIDRLAVNAFSELNHSTVDYATGKEPHKFRNFPASEHKYVFFPHGFISDAQSWVFTEAERSALYDNPDFRLVMSTILNGKNLLIVGFNAAEWSFLRLLKDIGITGKISGYHNYYLCPDVSESKRHSLEEVGISVIKYHPSTEEHTELREIIDSIIGYQSLDDILPSIYSGKQYKESDIPSPRSCSNYSLRELRDILNGVVASIIPPDQVPTSEQVKKLESFYNTYVIQLHNAWIVDERAEEANDVYGYKVTRQIGRGSFGSVFEVEDPNGNRYALKVLLPEVKDKISFLSCFRRGIRSLKILTDKNIPGMVKIHDSYEVPACIIMDLVDGITLREAIANKYLSDFAIKLKLLTKVAEIIHSAHQLEERILHRDLKPENIMLESCYSALDFSDTVNIPVVKILDFDLSWHRGATEKTVVVGAASQGFMAPELIDTVKSEFVCKLL